MVTGKTAKSILISCGARMAPFDIKELRELTDEDEMDLDRLGIEKTTLKDMAEVLGRETINFNTTNDTRGMNTP